MLKQTFLRLALPTPLRRLFDYLPPQLLDVKALLPGMRVRVPFQSRTLVGVLMEVVSETSIPYEKLKTALEVLDERPVVMPDVFQLCQWAAAYYHYSLGEVLAGALPTLLRKGAAATFKPSVETPPVLSEEPVLCMNTPQQQAVAAICESQGHYQTFLLDGVTGSGKTEVYLRAMAAFLQAGQQVLVLVPEISLTPQTIARFQSRFPVVIAALHSSLTEKQRLQAWLKAREGEAKIVIGTRSAIFTPFANLGLIIVDEEHDGSFKQQDRFRYHARDLAIMRANALQLPVVLGSATPSLETLLNAERERYRYLALPERAGVAELPRFQVVDVGQTVVEEGLSDTLLQAISDHLAANNQVMLFLNRRGFSPVYYCTECAWIVECKRCDARMVYHKTPPRLQCHHCDARMQVPVKCGACHASAMQPVGLGTQRLEQVLARRFPDVPLIRVDRDSTRQKGALQDLLDQIHREPRAILLGTQMLAKGHHFPQVTLVGVLDADSGLFSADFRAAEQMGQLLLQVSGRAGRAEKPGVVFIQTRHPEHPLLQLLTGQGYQPFARKLLAERAHAWLPPYTYFAVFRAEAYSQSAADIFLTNIRALSRPYQSALSVLGPVPALLAKRKGLHCLNLLIKAKKRSHLQQFLGAVLPQLDKLPAAPAVKWVLDVDPVEV